MKESLIPYRTTVHEKKPVKCKICLIRFGGKGDMNRHQRTVHENEKPLKCKICPISFGGKDDLFYAKVI